MSKTKKVIIKKQVAAALWREEHSPCTQFSSFDGKFCMEIKLIISIYNFYRYGHYTTSRINYICTINIFLRTYVYY